MWRATPRVSEHLRPLLGVANMSRGASKRATQGARRADQCYGQFDILCQLNKNFSPKKYF